MEACSDLSRAVGNDDAFLHAYATIQQVAMYQAGISRSGRFHELTTELTTIIDCFFLFFRSAFGCA